MPEHCEGEDGDKDKAEKCGAEKLNPPAPLASIFLPDIFLLYLVFNFSVAVKSFLETHTADTVHPSV